MNLEDIIRFEFLPPDAYRLTDVSSWHGHVPFGTWCVTQLKPRILVELGTHKGDSYFSFCETIRTRSLSTQAHAVDTWKGEEHAGTYGEEVFTEVSDYNNRNFSGFSSLVRLTFDEASAKFPDRSVDLLHIDGLHTYEAVRHDFEKWEPKLSDRAIVLFHDISEKQRDFGVWRFWGEISQGQDTFEFPHSHGLGVLIFGKNALPIFRDLSALKGGDRCFVQAHFEALGGRVVIAGLRTQINARETRLFEQQSRLIEQDRRLIEQQTRLIDQQSRLVEQDRRLMEQEEQIRSPAMRISRRIVDLRNRWAPAGTMRGRLVSFARRRLLP